MAAFDRQSRSTDRELVAQEISVQIRNLKDLANPLNEELIRRCSRGLPGFEAGARNKVIQLIESREWTLSRSLGTLRAPQDYTSGDSASVRDKRNEAPSVFRTQIPLHGTLLLFNSAVSYSKLERYLHDTSQRLAPVESLLSVLLTHRHVQPSYEAKGLLANTWIAGECSLMIPGLNDSLTPTIISDGGLIYESGGGDAPPRPSLFGARVGSGTFEFFLPYKHRESNSGWKSGTLFLVEPVR